MSNYPNESVPSFPHSSNHVDGNNDEVEETLLLVHNDTSLLPMRECEMSFVETMQSWSWVSRSAESLNCSGFLYPAASCRFLLWADFLKTFLMGKTSTLYVPNYEEHYCTPYYLKNIFCSCAFFIILSLFQYLDYFATNNFTNFNLFVLVCSINFQFIPRFKQNGQ